MEQTLNVFTPLAQLDEARPLAVALGVAAGDAADAWAGTFFAAMLDADGREWRGLSTTRDLAPVTAALSAEMPTPALRAAQARLLVWRPPADPEAPAQPMPRCADHPDRIIVIIGLPGVAAREAAGLRTKPAEGGA